MNLFAAFAMASRVVTAQPSALGVVTAFLTAFVVGSLAVQLFASAPRGGTGVEPVTAHQASLWEVLGSR